MLSASQMWCLGRFLPMIVGSHIPAQDEKWNLFLTLLEITDIIFADAITVNKASYLQDLLEYHHTQFVQLYPNASVIPKMHYILHYPRTMLRYYNFHVFFYLLYCCFSNTTFRDKLVVPANSFLMFLEQLK